jgi:hypothetical protein
MAMLEGEPDLTLELLNRATQAWIQHAQKASCTGAGRPRWCLAANGGRQAAAGRRQAASGWRSRRGVGRGMVPKKPAKMR